MNKIVYFLNSNTYALFVQTALNGFTVLYFLTLDVMGSNWAIITEHQKLHTVLFISLLFASMVISITRCVYSRISCGFGNTRVAVNVLQSFINSVGFVVQAKIDRFRTILPSISKDTNTFTTITQPNDQLRILSNSIVGFITHAYSIRNDQINITILQKRNKTRWSYLYRHHTWKYTEATIIMKEKSAATYCLACGEDLFITDKRDAARAGKFYISKRDDDKGEGSAYIYPLTFDTKSGEVIYIVSIITYGVALCREYETSAKDITKAFLREFVRRIELELSLYTMKAQV